MRAAIALRNIVRITEHIFLIAIVPLQRSLDAHVVLDHREMEHAVVNRGFVAIQMFDKGLYAALVFENLFLLIAFIDKVDAYT